VFLFLTTRSLRKREREPIEEPVWLRELDAPMRLAELEREASTRPIEVHAGNGQSAVGQGANGARGGDEIRRQVEQLADSDPDRVAAQLRTWMQED
jgi:flagellar M-ring protein FliF